MTVDEIIKILDLKPHPEGGFYRETYISKDSLSLPERYLQSNAGTPLDRSCQRESMEWQVPPELEREAMQRSAQMVASHDDDIWSPVDKHDNEGRGQANDTPRAVCTSIYYLLTADTFSCMHRLMGDEIYHFYFGDPVEMLNIHPSGKFKTIRLGHDITNGAKVQYVVPYGVWQGSRLVDGGKFALMGTTMSPGFSFSDFEEGKRSKLIEHFPSCADLITKLTKPE